MEGEELSRAVAQAIGRWLRGFVPSSVLSVLVCLALFW